MSAPNTAAALLQPHPLAGHTSGTSPRVAWAWGTARALALRCLRAPSPPSPPGILQTQSGQQTFTSGPSWPWTWASSPGVPGPWQWMASLLTGTNLQEPRDPEQTHWMQKALPHLGWRVSSSRLTWSTFFPFLMDAPSVGMENVTPLNR